MIYFLDTNICIYHLNNSAPSLSRILDQTPIRNIKIPSMVVAELLYGALKSAKRQHNLTIFTSFLSLFEIVDFDEKAAELYAAIRVELERKGQMIGGNDLVIAATVLAREGTLVTHNMSEFSRIEGLVLNDWTL
ncbi:MAG: type II toxin-antitoxin system VapC family toxin [Synergistaceae bacterium]|nr:type II toxin-antitoxin system VapC family toxin [Synergistaceae bacterium]